MNTPALAKTRWLALKWVAVGFVVLALELAVVSTLTLADASSITQDFALDVAVGCALSLTLVWFAIPALTARQRVRTWQTAAAALVVLVMTLSIAFASALFRGGRLLGISDARSLLGIAPLFVAYSAIPAVVVALGFTRQLGRLSGSTSTAEDVSPNPSLHRTPP